MPKTNREAWVEELRNSELNMSDDTHILSSRWLHICRSEVDQCAADPLYQPPSVDEEMAKCPWGPF